MMATIKTGPHSTARGVLVTREGDEAAIITNGKQMRGPVIDLTHTDDQDHDMTPLMERRK